MCEYSLILSRDLIPHVNLPSFSYRLVTHVPVILLQLDYANMDAGLFDASNGGILLVVLRF